VRDGLPVLEDGRVLEVANIVWCTGFRPDLSWIDVPVFNGDSKPTHDRGIVDSEPGLYFVGLEFLYAVSSSQINGVARDAKHVVKAVAARSERTRVKPSALSAVT
jgi:putative flavoprotein involved in K+ transport